MSRMLKIPIVFMKKFGVVSTHLARISRAFSGGLRARCSMCLWCCPLLCIFTAFYLHSGGTLGTPVVQAIVGAVLMYEFTVQVGDDGTKPFNL